MSLSDITIQFTGSKGSGKSVTRKFIEKALRDAGAQVEHKPTDKMGDDDTLKVLITKELCERSHDINGKDLANAVRSFLIAEASQMANEGKRFAADHILEALENLSDGQLARLAKAVRDL